jgi:HlyD family secretion protein
VKKKMAEIIGGVVLILLLIGVWAWPKPDSFKEIALKYDFVTAKRMDLSEKIDATGNVVALEKKDLYSDYEGAVDKVNVKAGDYVKKGDILVSVTSATLKQQWQDADFSLKQAELGLDQTTAELATEVALNKITKTNALLVEGNYHKVDLYKQQVKQAKERLDALKLKNDGYYMANNETLLIRAPFSGQVAWVNVSQGDKILPQTVLATVMKPDNLGVEAQIDQNDISMVKPGQNALITGKDPGQSQNPGYVMEISVLGQAAQDVVSFPVRIKLAGNSRGLKPGMSVDVTVLADEHPQTLAIPAGSVTSKDGRDLVNVRRNDRIVPVAVELGLKHGKFWEVKSGLKAGDQVAVPKPPLLAKQPVMTGGSQRTGMFGR